MANATAASEARTSPTDEHIQRDVLAELEYDDSHLEKSAAWMAPGVTAVDNRITSAP